MGKIDFSEEVQGELFSAVLEDKIGDKINMPDADFLKEQLQKPDSKESKILLKGYREIAGKLESNPKELPLIKNIVDKMKDYQEYNNENLQNIISRRFDIKQGNG